MKVLKYEIEASAVGYVERLFVDGSLNVENIYKSNGHCAKMISESPLIDDYCYDNEDLSSLGAELSNFIGLAMVRLIREREESES